MGYFLNHQFDKNNRTDTVVIYGCGSSINDLTDLDRYTLSQFDSVAFNWFCFSHIPVTYYIVREQANIPKRVHGDETIDNFYYLINKYYKNSILVVHNLYHHSPKAFNYNNNYHKEPGRKFVPHMIGVKDIKLKGNDPGVERWREESIFKNGIYHGKTTMTNALHFVVWMGYSRIIFVGVDLYDSRYFWMGDKTRYSVKNKNKTKESKHQTAGDTLSLIKKVKEVYLDIKMYTYNKKSLLSNVIRVWQ